uniref:Uncharacterized protein n=1 Tax=Timema cristinae TaxID=61476 RepID=A0A7R9D3E7_TIMCR|nr:unnamed protein product [Timema cristinae]
MVSSLQILFAKREVEPGLRAHRLKKLKGKRASPIHVLKFRWTHIKTDHRKILQETKKNHNFFLWVFTEELRNAN